MCRYGVDMYKFQRLDKVLIRAGSLRLRQWHYVVIFLFQLFGT
jgi:hypothetical protein